MDASVEKVLVNPDIETISGRTKGSFKRSCPGYFDEMFLSRSYRSASEDVTINELDWLVRLGAQRAI